MQKQLQMSLRKKKNPLIYQNQEHFADMDDYEENNKPNSRKDVNPPIKLEYLLCQIVSEIYQPNQLKYDFTDSDYREHRRQSSKEKQKKIASAEDKITSEVKKKVKTEQNSDAHQNPNRKYSSNIYQDKTNEQRPNSKKEHEEHAKKKDKQLYRFKDQHNIKNLIPHGADPKNPPKPALNLGNSYQSNLFMLQNLQAPYIFSLNDFNQNLLPGSNMLNPSTLMLQQFGQKIPPYNYQDLFKIGNFEQVVNYLQNQSTINIKKPTIEKTAEKKLFKRSAFHVAIAYHIHLRKIQDKGKDMVDSKQVDPTYFAKRLRDKKQDTGDVLISSQKGSVDKNLT